MTCNSNLFDMTSSCKTHEEFARELGISRTTLYRLMKRHAIQAPRGLLAPHDQQRFLEAWRGGGATGQPPMPLKQDETT